MKRYGWLITALLLVVFAGPAGAVVLLNHDAALKAMFPDAGKVLPEATALTAEQIAAVKAVCGGKWTMYPAGAKTDDVAVNDTVTFYFGTKDGKKTGVAVMEMQPGKWGPVHYIVALDLTGKVTNMAVMSYVEQRGRPISTRRFLEQFIGKTSKSALSVGKDVDAVSGATISSRATAFAVKKAIALYEAVYLAPEQ
ncbi:FMN-binding protein [candidate division WOR-3 bacterium]|uniref:FMN-binding protein n=1 Tax=candidate division WOR-3 bacterium TaxID=2052148 RepID=A0A937XCR9_UNCW3|nr:FMN-binding protein [candidate division WOR-3 bacterium]